MQKVTEKSLAVRLLRVATKRLCLLRMLRIRRLRARIEAIQFAKTIG